MLGCGCSQRQWRCYLICCTMAPILFLVLLIGHMCTKGAIERSMVAAVYSLTCSGIACPCILMAACGQLDVVLRGSTVKFSVVARRTGEVRAAASWRNLKSFLLAPTPPSLLP